MNPISYNDTLCLTDPFQLGWRHLQAAAIETEWQDRVVHVITGLLEMIPIINYIVAIFDRIFFESFAQDQFIADQEQGILYSLGLDQLGITNRDECLVLLAVGPEKLREFGLLTNDDLFTVFGKIDLDQKLSLLSDAIEAFPENKKGFVELLQGLLKEVERVVGCEHLAKRLEGIVEKANAENSPSPSVIYHSDEFQLLVQFLKQGDKSFKISCIKAYAFQPGIDAFWKDERVKAASRNEGLATLVSMWKLFAKPENPWAEPDVYELAKQMNRL